MQWAALSAINLVNYDMCTKTFLESIDRFNWLKFLVIDRLVHCLNLYVYFPFLHFVKI